MARQEIIELDPHIEFEFKGKRLVITAAHISIILYRDQVQKLARICDVFLMETDEKLQKEIAALEDKHHT